MISFQWPLALWGLALAPLLVGVYLYLLWRQKNAALRFASLGLIKAAQGPYAQWRRHLPPALMLAALIMMIIAAARPSASLTMPTRSETIVLAMDVSGSMNAEDVAPNRLAAAQDAARAFTVDVPARARLSVVSFAGTAAIVQSPTHDREPVLAAINRFQLQRGTAIGSGLILSMAALFPDEGFQVSPSDNTRDRGNRRNSGNEYTPPSATPKVTASAPLANPKHVAVAPGSYTSAAIILLSDGRTTTGPDPMEAARLAADYGVRVFTVGIGTLDGAALGFEGWSMHVSLDEDALKDIAKLTMGEYFYAGNAADLKKIYQSLNSKLVMETKQSEVSAVFAAIAAALSLLAALLSLAWFNRVL